MWGTATWGSRRCALATPGSGRNPLQGLCDPGSFGLGDADIQSRRRPWARPSRARSPGPDVNEAATQITLSNVVSVLLANANTSSGIRLADVSITADGLGTAAEGMSGLTLTTDLKGDGFVDATDLTDVKRCKGAKVSLLP